MGFECTDSVNSPFIHLWRIGVVVYSPRLMRSSVSTLATRLCRQVRLAIMPTHLHTHPAYLATWWHHYVSRRFQSDVAAAHLYHNQLQKHEPM